MPKCARCGAKLPLLDWHESYDREGKRVCRICLPEPEVLYDLTIRPKCSTYGRPMILLEKGGETWRCDYDKTEASEQQLADLRILREQTRPSYVILVDGSSGKELSLRDVSIKNTEGVMSGFFLGGLVGAGFAMAEDVMHARDGEYDKATQDIINETIRKKPRLYPYGKHKILMLCPRCREEVRSDQQYCEQCGAKLVMPIPRYAWI